MKSIPIGEEVNASKDTISGDAVWQLVEGSKKIVVASGKKCVEYSPADDREEILTKISGRTGNLRAPSLRVGKTFYIGFNEEMYRDLSG